MSTHVLFIQQSIMLSVMKTQPTSIYTFLYMYSQESMIEIYLALLVYSGTRYIKGHLWIKYKGHFLVPFWYFIMLNDPSTNKGQ